MALNITTLATRWGKEIAGVNEACTYAGTTAVNRADTIDGQFSAFASQRDVTDDLYEELAKVQSGLSEWTEYLASLPGLTLQAMCRDDSARPETDDLLGWFAKLNRDMVSQAESFTRPTVTGTVAVSQTYGGSNVGDGYLISSVIDPVDGVGCYYAHSEVIRLRCVASSYDGSATAGSEDFNVLGETSVAALDPRWPKGSGADTTIVAVTPVTAAVLDGGRLDDSDWTGTSLTDWNAVGGTFGAAANGVISKSTTSTYTPNVSGAAFALMTGDAALHLGIYQALDQENVVVKANTNYAFQFWIKASSGSGSAGLSVAFRDGSASIITDNAASSQEVTFSSGTVNGSNGVWTRIAGVLRTPRSLPTELRFDIRTNGTALAAGRTLGIDHVTLAEMERVYDGGPFIKVIAGATAFAVDDGFTDTIANDKTTTNFVRSLDRVFDLKGNSIRLTTAVIGSATPGTGTQSDALIA